MTSTTSVPRLLNAPTPTPTRSSTILVPYVKIEKVHLIYTMVEFILEMLVCTIGWVAYFIQNNAQKKSYLGTLLLISSTCNTIIMIFTGDRIRRDIRFEGNGEITETDYLSYLIADKKREIKIIFYAARFLIAIWTLSSVFASCNSLNLFSCLVLKIISVFPFAIQMLTSLFNRITNKYIGIAHTISNNAEISIDITSIKFSDVSEQIKKDQECVVCCNAFLETDDVCKFGCDHIFHHGCATSWLKSPGSNNQCPTCRQNIKNSSSYFKLDDVCDIENCVISGDN
jgi:hypothetical protein